MCDMPSRATVHALAEVLGIQPLQTRIWFQNKRQRARKKHTADHPPNPVTAALQATPTPLDGATPSRTWVACAAPTTADALGPSSLPHSAQVARVLSPSAHRISSASSMILPPPHITEQLYHPLPTLPPHQVPFQQLLERELLTAEGAGAFLKSESLSLSLSLPELLDPMMRIPVPVISTSAPSAPAPTANLRHRATAPNAALTDAIDVFDDRCMMAAQSASIAAETWSLLLPWVPL